jgi:hypothetical protein
MATITVRLLNTKNLVCRMTANYGGGTKNLVGRVTVYYVVNTKNLVARVTALVSLGLSTDSYSFGPIARNLVSRTTVRKGSTNALVSRVDCDAGLRRKSLVCRLTVTYGYVSYYFDSYYATYAWMTNPSRMTDGSTSTYASTTSTGDVQQLTSNTAVTTRTENIKKVELRLYGKRSTSTETIYLRSVM